MNKLPVDKCIDVLNIFCAHQQEELWVNKIVEKVCEATSSKDTPKIKEAIRILKNSKVIGANHSGSHRQKRIITLTDLGEEIVNLIELLTRCNSSHDKLLNIIMKYCIKINENLDPESGIESISNVLVSRGWTRSETDYYESIMIAAFNIENIYRKNISNALLERYSNIVTSYKANNNVHQILLKIVMETIIQITKNIGRIEEYRQEIYNNEKKTSFSGFDYRRIGDNPFAESIPLICDDIEEFYLDFEPILIKQDITKSIEEMTLNLMTLLNPEPELLFVDSEEDVFEEDVDKKLDIIESREKELLEKIKTGLNLDDIGIHSEATELSIIKYKKIILKYIKST